jgi:hypothetical protein
MLHYRGTLNVLLFTLKHVYSYCFSLKIETCFVSTRVDVCLVNVTYLVKKNDGNSIIVFGVFREVIGGLHTGIQPLIRNGRHPDVGVGVGWGGITSCEQT